MKLFSIDIEKGLDIVERVNAKYKPAFDKFTPAQQAALAWYFTSITILTKNPAALVKAEYLKALQSLASLP